MTGFLLLSAVTLHSAAVDFDRDVLPILTAHCFSCHGAEKQRNGLRLDRRESLLKGGDSGEPAVVPGKSGTSHLIQRVTATDKSQVMPPKGERLTPEQVALLRRWIDAGAPMPVDAQVADAARDHWSLRPVRMVPLPDSRDPFVVNPIDAFILARLHAQQLTPSPLADRRTLVRRVYLDMLGLPPAPAEIDAFVNDMQPEAYKRLIERVLASPRYGERWAQHWLDVVRYGDSHGFEVNTPRPNSWPYRDWVIRSLNEDKPYPRFIFEQLAGDSVGEDAATGFLVAGPALLSGQVGKDLPSILQARQDELNEILSNTATTFLGLTVGCARCHNHKFDAISQADYYALQAVFAGVRYGERPLRSVDTEQRRRERADLTAELAQIERRLDDLEPLARTDGKNEAGRPAVNPRRNVERFEAVDARFIRFTVTQTNNSIEPCIDEVEIFSAEDPPRNVALASAGARASASSTFPNSSIHKLAHINDDRFGNGRSWISAERGKGWVQIELSRTMRIDRIVWARDREGKYNDRLPVAYQIEVAAEPNQWRLAASSADRLPYGGGTKGVPALSVEKWGEYAALRERQADLRRRLDESRGGQPVFAGVFQPAETVHRLYRGDPQQKREEMAPDALAVFLASLGSLRLDTKTPEQERRIALANWIARPDHPLTARVLVNRLWQHHFGTGLVETASDFGRNGARPSHPELLDYLAESFVRSGWSIKAMHRLILTSSTYRQASTPRADALQVDVQSRLLWRYPPRRLEAEVMRDSILAASGVLDLRMGGPGFLVFKPNDNYVRVYDAKEEWGPADWRRMVYMHKVRMAQDGVFGAFDCPDAGLPAPRRSRSTTAIQALNLFNSSFMIQQAELFAKRVEKEAGAAPDAQVRHAFLLAIQRPPTESEQQACVQVARAHGLAAVCRVLFNTNEFLFLP